MTVLADRPHQMWLHRETPLGVPAFTPLRVRPLSENCYFEIDGMIVRMVFLGGLSGYDDPSASAWTLRATPQADLSGIEFWNGWNAQNSKPLLVLNAAAAANSAIESHKDSIAMIERVTGYSRRKLTTWLRTSHTTLNGIVNSPRNPRSHLAARIVNFCRIITRLEALYGDDQEIIRKALEYAPEGGTSALQLVLEDDYQQAATAAQRAIRPTRHIKPVRGQKFYDSQMVAVEDI